VVFPFEEHSGADVDAQVSPPSRLSLLALTRTSEFPFPEPSRRID
jgi:hypothetical protein